MNMIFLCDVMTCIVDCLKDTTPFCIWWYNACYVAFVCCVVVSVMCCVCTRGMLERMYSAFYILKTICIKRLTRPTFNYESYPARESCSDIFEINKRSATLCWNCRLFSREQRKPSHLFQLHWVQYNLLLFVWAVVGNAAFASQGKEISYYTIR